MKRKTVEVKSIVEQVNDVLLHSADQMADYRWGQIEMLASILHRTGNYHGFNYLDKDMMSKSKLGTSVGIREYNEEEQRWNFKNTDDTRVYYYC